MVDGGARRATARVAVRTADAGGICGRGRRRTAWWCVALFAVLAGPWCPCSSAGSGTTGVLGVAKLPRGPGGDEQPVPARRGFDPQGPARQAP
jgi:hypothetical protein